MDGTRKLIHNLLTYQMICDMVAKLPTSILEQDVAG